MVLAEDPARRPGRDGACRIRLGGAGSHGTTRPPAGLRPHRAVLVVGGSQIGQLCCRLARHFGAGRVYLSEPSAGRRSYAEASEADRAFNPSVDAPDIERLKADAVLECSGAESGLTAALAAARPEGTVVVVGGGRAGLDP